METNIRVFVGWNSGAYVTTHNNPEFTAQLTELIARWGSPDTVELRQDSVRFPAVNLPDDFDGRDFEFYSVVVFQGGEDEWYYFIDDDGQPMDNFPTVEAAEQAIAEEDIQGPVYIMRQSRTLVKKVEP